MPETYITPSERRAVNGPALQQAIDATQYLDNGFFTEQQLLAGGPNSFKIANAAALNRSNLLAQRAQTGLSLTNSALSARENLSRIDGNNANLSSYNDFVNGGGSPTGDQLRNPLILEGLRNRDTLEELELNRRKRGIESADIGIAEQISQDPDMQAIRKRMQEDAILTQAKTQAKALRELGSEGGFSSVDRISQLSAAGMLGDPSTAEGRARAEQVTPVLNVLKENPEARQVVDMLGGMQEAAAELRSMGGSINLPAMQKISSAVMQQLAAAGEVHPATIQSIAEIRRDTISRAQSIATERQATEGMALEVQRVANVLGNLRGDEQLTELGKLKGSLLLRKERMRAAIVPESDVKEVTTEIDRITNQITNLQKRRAAGGGIEGVDKTSISALQAQLNKLSLRMAGAAPVRHNEPWWARGFSPQPLSAKPAPPPAEKKKQEKAPAAQEPLDLTPADIGDTEVIILFDD